jgi:hypothetical protein
VHIHLPNHDGALVLDFLHTPARLHLCTLGVVVARANMRLVPLDIQIIFDYERYAVGYAQRRARLPSSCRSCRSLFDKPKPGLCERGRVRAVASDIS